MISKINCREIDCGRWDNGIMTINKLIVKLQALREQGKGNYIVYTAIEDEICQLEEVTVSEDYKRIYLQSYLD